MALSAGTSIGHYDVTALLGEGGMGQVWQATDTQLNRQVALKILPDAFADDPDRLARFTREAQILASLNHPNIAAIFGIEEAEGTRALVLELVEGPTLADRIAKGPIPLDEALPIARQIAEALEAAHEAGVIHRDLKPANIKVREDGTVKVLDFGLAKALARDVSDADLSQSPTVTASGTREGVILGTAAYMSPEQARGKSLDKRTDTWSFGCVLYEMLAGRGVFMGETLSDTIANVLDREPDWTVLPNDMPTVLGSFLRGCLEKSPRSRVQAIGDVRLAMEGAFEVTGTAPSDSAGGPTIPVWQRPAPLVIAALLVAVVLSFAVWAYLGNDTQPSPSPKRFTLTLPDSDRLPRNIGDLLALSPDGQTLVYRATRDGTLQHFRRPMDQFDAAPMIISGIETISPGDISRGTAFFSPDGQWVGFRAGATVLKVALAGGPPQTLAAFPGGGRGADWGPDDAIVLGSNGGLVQIPGAGGQPTTLFPPGEQLASSYPQILPGGDAVLFTLSRPDGDELHVVFRETGQHRTIVPTATKGRVLSTGHLVFVRNGALWAVPFDQDRFEIVGTPVPVVDGVRVETAGDDGGAVQYAIADDGTLVYLPGGVADGDHTLVLADRQGTVTAVPVRSATYVYPRFSPDGTRIVVQIDTGNGSDIFVYELPSKRLRQLTFNGGAWPIWTPDGTQVTFNANDALWNIAADFSEEPQLLGTGSEDFGIAGPLSWESPDIKVGRSQRTVHFLRGVSSPSVIE